MERKKIIVIGGGFAGIQLVKHLDENLFDVLLIDKLNHHQFQPLFYQVATSQIEPGTISFPLRKIFQRRKNTQIRITEVTGIVPSENRVKTTIGDFEYDYLVIANGCKTNFFGNQELMKHAYGLKSTYDAIRIRNKILQNFEDILSADNSTKEYLMNIVIVGAGPTGVELAGAFSEIKRHILPKDFPSIDFRNLKIILLDAADYPLNSMSDMAKHAAEKYLRKMGVDVLTKTMVKSYDGQILTLSSGEQIKTKHLIWAAGVTGEIIQGLPEGAIKNNSRIIVDRHNRVKDHQNIFAVGDIAYMETPKYPKGHPQVANVAINQARNLATNLKALMKGRSLKEFEYRNLGVMATIGKNKAVVDLPFASFKGYFAWLVWMFLHLMLILSVRNKLIIFINWAWSYITSDTALRLILNERCDSEKAGK